MDGHPCSARNELSKQASTEAAYKEENHGLV